MATELTDRQKFYKILPISKQIILLMQQEVWLIYTHSGKSTSYEQNPKTVNNYII